MQHAPIRDFLKLSFPIALPFRYFVALSFEPFICTALAEVFAFNVVIVVIGEHFFATALIVLIMLIVPALFHECHIFLSAYNIFGFSAEIAFYVIAHYLH